jgi:hypothetical protein
MTVRVCEISDIECSNRCGAGACKKANAAPAPTNVDDNLKATDGPLLELDVLLARFHEDVWESASQSLCAYDEAGVEEAKAIQRHVRAMLASAAPAEGREGDK